MQDRPVPFDALQGRLLPVADAVMVLMLSRPASGTLRDTRVTIVTIYLAGAVAILALVLAGLGLVLGLGGHAWPWIVASIVLLALFAGCLDLAVYGVRQRLLASRQ